MERVIISKLKWGLNLLGNNNIKLINFHTGPIDNLLKDIFSYSLITFLFKISGLFLGYVFTLFISRKFGTYSMGVFSLATAILNILSVIGRFGFDTALLKFVAEYSAKKRMDLVKVVYIRIIKIVVPFCILLSLLLFFFSPYITKYYFGKDYFSIILKIISFVILPMVLIFINSESLRGLKKIKEYAFIQNMAIYFIATIMLGLSFLVTRHENVPIIVYCISIVFVFVVSEIIWLKHSRINNMSYKSDSVKLKTILDISIPMMFISYFAQVIMLADIILLGIFRTEHEVGIYAVAVRIAMVLFLPLFAIGGIAAPKIAECHAINDRCGFVNTIKYSAKMMFWSSSPIAILIFIFPSFILGIFGEEFKAGHTALLVLTLGHYLNTIMGSAGFVLQMSGKEKIFRNILLITSLINIALNFILIPKYGLNGAAFTSMVSMVFLSISSVIFVKYYFKVMPVHLTELKIIKKS